MNGVNSCWRECQTLLWGVVLSIGLAGFAAAQDKKPGETQPPATPPAKPADPAPAQPPAKPADPAQPPAKPSIEVRKDLPAGKDIIEKHLKAIGGKEAVLKHTSKTVKGTVSMPQMGGDMEMEIYGAAPNKMFQRVVMGQMGEMTAGFDGTVAWSVSMMGPTIMEDEQAEALKKQAEFHDEIRDLKKYKTVDTVDLADFEGRKCYKLRLVEGEGEKAEESFEFYDAETGLQAGQISQRAGMGGSMEATMVFVEYKEFGGVKTPCKMLMKAMGMEQTITIKSVDYDTVDPKVFELPQEIKDLQKENAALDKAAGDKATGDKPAPGSGKPATDPTKPAPEKPAGGEPKPKP